ncbi:MAG: ATP synthase F0 subunit C [Chloroflexi bacterium]|nr:ATP synthase F0 subunit C [Chloroflexota bacterium]MBI3733533.1 ATP synthase F0 subunit C [Chloroflexota bacterium]
MDLSALQQVALSDAGLRLLATALAIGLGTIGPGIGIGVVVNAAIHAIGRNPDAAGQAQLNMFLGIAFTEALAIFALVVALLIGFKIL